MKTITTSFLAAAFSLLPIVAPAQAQEIPQRDATPEEMQSYCSGTESSSPVLFVLDNDTTQEQPFQILICKFKSVVGYDCKGLNDYLDGMSLLNRRFEGYQPNRTDKYDHFIGYVKRLARLADNCNLALS